MKRIVTLALITATLFSFHETHAQSLRDRVRNKIFKENKEAVAEQDSATTEEMEEMEESAESAVTQLGNRAMMNALGLTGNVPIEDSYDFDAFIQMEITTYKKNGDLDETVIYDNYIHKKEADYAMVFRDEDAQSTIIFDSKNNAMLILADSDGEKTGFATSVDPEAMAEEYAEEEEADMEDYRPMKTGKTKQILGYRCDEYLVEDEETEVHMWVSEELGKEMRKDWMSNQQTFGAMFVHAFGMNGMTLEYDVIEKDGEKSIMQVTDIQLDHKHRVDTGDYTIMSMKMNTEEMNTEEE